MEDCIFCKIVKGEITTEKVYEDNDVIAFKDIKPAATVHILLCPKKHIESFLRISNNFDVTPMVKAAQRIIGEKNIQEGYKLVINGGKYQEVPHLHWHLLGGDLK